MLRTFISSLLLLVAMSAITGIAYPLAITGVAQGLFPGQANGSVLKRGDSKLGSSLIGQPFAEPRYFWSRPSATAPFPNNSAAGAGSNLGPTNPALAEAVQARIAKLRDADPQHRDSVPIDLVTTSSSGLDPHISPAGAEYQVARVAAARGLSEDDVRKLVATHTQPRTLGVLGEPRVNVLELNLALDVLATTTPQTP